MTTQHWQDNLDASSLRHQPSHARTSNKHSTISFVRFVDTIGKLAIHPEVPCPRHKASWNRMNQIAQVDVAGAVLSCRTFNGSLQLLVQDRQICGWWCRRWLRKWVQSSGCTSEIETRTLEWIRWYNQWKRRRGLEKRWISKRDYDRSIDHSGWAYIYTLENTQSRYNQNRASFSNGSVTFTDIQKPGRIGCIMREFHALHIRLHPLFQVSFPS